MKRTDSYALIALILLCAFFFWRILTPIQSDQASFRQGDFSGQFVAFGAYQYQRMSDGQIPLWNPYNNGGLPFIADTQAAVFYPPRLLTIALSRLSSGWSYASLQLEAVFHVLLYTGFMYAFLRRLTIGQPFSVWAALTGAVIAGYSGFITGYPLLQLALLEAATWLPLVLLAILEAARPNALYRWFWVSAAGFALGLSWMAGHPQTSWFITVFLLAWLAYQTWQNKIGWKFMLQSTLLIALVSAGTTAVTLLPSAEYLIYTSRTNLSFDAKANGFPIRDIIQFLLPGTVSLYSPLYVGIPALLLAFAALHSSVKASLFWITAALVSLLHSFGANGALYPLLYNILPGLRYFRGQERAAFLVSFSLAVLAALGIHAMMSMSASRRQSMLRVTAVLFVLLLGLSLLTALVWFAQIGSNLDSITSTAIQGMLITGAIWLLIAYREQIRETILLGAILSLIVLELFNVNMDTTAVYDPVPASRQALIQTPELVNTLLADAASAQPFRVDGFRGLRDNYGSMVNLMDIRGISPLFLSSAQRIIYQDYISNPLAWELFAVKYIFSERDTLSAFPTQMIAQGVDRDGTVYLHQVANPRSFAHLIYRADVVDSDEFAYALANDPRYDLRGSIILNQQPGVDLPQQAPTGSSVMVTHFAPEQIQIELQTEQPAVLSLAMVDYPGWQATINGVSVPVLRAYGALMALPIPQGSQIIELTYQPLSFQLGAGLSLFTWSGMVILALVWFWRMRQQPRSTQE
jgi:hypothetical protein